MVQSPDRKLLLKYHPDKKVGVTDTKESDAKFLHVQKAFDVLSDSQQRRGWVAVAVSPACTPPHSLLRCWISGLVFFFPDTTLSSTSMIPFQRVMRRLIVTRTSLSCTAQSSVETPVSVRTALYLAWVTCPHPWTP